MSRLQWSILSIKGPILGSKGPNLEPRGLLESKVGGKRVAFIWVGDSLDQGALPRLISPTSPELWLRHWVRVRVR